MNIWGKSFQAEGTEKTIALKQEEAWNIWETNTKPVALESDERGRGWWDRKSGQKADSRPQGSLDHDKGVDFYLIGSTF